MAENKQNKAQNDADVTPLPKLPKTLAELPQAQAAVVALSDGLMLPCVPVHYADGWLSVRIGSSRLPLFVPERSILYVLVCRSLQQAERIAASEDEVA